MDEHGGAKRIFLIYNFFYVLTEIWQSTCTTLYIHSGSINHWIFLANLVICVPVIE